MKCKYFMHENNLQLIIALLAIYRVSKQNATEIQQAVVHHKRG
jgi:hypothetical protein